jgi:hypothetical protein
METKKLLLILIQNIEQLKKYHMSQYRISRLLLLEYLEINAL